MTSVLTPPAPPGLGVPPDEHELLVADPDELDRDGVLAVLQAAGRVRSKLDAIEMRARRRLRQLEAVGQAEPADAAIAAAAGGDGRHGKAVGERDELCLEAPEVEDALDEGLIAGAHVDAIAAAARDLPIDVRSEFLTHGDDLLARAGRLGIDAFRRECRQLAKQLLADSRAGSDADELEAQRAASKVSRWTDRVTGIHHTMIELDPIRDHELHRAVKRELQRLRRDASNADRTWNELEVQAWMNCTTGRAGCAVAGGVAPTASTTPRPADDRPIDVAGHGRTGAGGRLVDRAPQIIAVADVGRLRAEADTAGICETSDGRDLPTSTLRRLCCDAEIIPSVLDGGSAVVDHGRSRRTASPEQRQALTALHATCAFPGCTVVVDDCRIHHVEFWTRDVGPTDLANLLPLCERHHHLVHEGGWRVELDGDRVGSWFRPDGSRHHRGPTTDRLGDTGARPLPPRPSRAKPLVSDLRGDCHTPRS